VVHRAHPVSYWAGQVAFAWRACLAQVAASLSARE
jgi:hypothetical protein